MKSLLRKLKRPSVNSSDYETATHTSSCQDLTTRDTQKSRKQDKKKSRKQRKGKAENIYCYDASGIIENINDPCNINLRGSHKPEKTFFLKNTKINMKYM